MLVGILSSVCWFTLFLAGHIGLFHFRFVQNRFQAIARFFLGALAGHVFTVVLLGTWATWSEEAFHGGIPVALVSGILVLGCLFVLYMPFFFTIATSLSVQTMILIEQAPEKRLSVPELRERFASRAIVAGRLQTMVANGYLRQNGDQFQVQPKGRLIARVFSGIKSIWKLGKGG